jgi:hypothetical protein
MVFPITTAIGESGHLGFRSIAFSVADEAFFPPFENMPSRVRHVP